MLKLLLMMFHDVAMLFADVEMLKLYDVSKCSSGVVFIDCLLRNLLLCIILLGEIHFVVIFSFGIRSKYPAA